MIRLAVHGRAAHGSTPWLGENAILKAIDVFRRIETMPFAAESTEMFDRPSINLGRLNAGDAVNKVPDEAVMAVDIRYLPGQEPGAILEQIRAIPHVEVRQDLHPAAGLRLALEPVRDGAVRRHAPGGAGGRDGRRPRRRVGRDLVPGGGRPGGRVRARSAAATTGRRSGSRSRRWRRYREALVDFMRAVPIDRRRRARPARRRGRPRVSAISPEIEDARGPAGRMPVARARRASRS